MSKLTIKLEGDREILVTRHFSAPPEEVYRAHMEPELLKKWLTGPTGWKMPVCINETHPGGKIRFEWKNEHGEGFYLTGEYVALEPNRRIVHVERMHLPDPTPDNHVDARFDPDGEGTLLTMLMTLPDAKTRESMMSTGMEGGMEESYARLESLLKPAM